MTHHATLTGMLMKVYLYERNYHFILLQGYFFALIIELFTVWQKELAQPQQVCKILVR